MAKVTGGLFSLSASGGFAKTLVFATSRGVNYVRQLVTPANPKTATQTTNRNTLRISAAAQSWVNRQMALIPGQAIMAKAAITANAIAGLAWNSSLVKAIVGDGSINFTTDSATWTGFSPAQKTAWDTAAAALNPPMMAVPQDAPFGAPAAPESAGRAYFHLIAGMWRLGAASQPTGTPPAGL